MLRDYSIPQIDLCETIINVRTREILEMIQYFGNMLTRSIIQRIAQSF